MRKILLTLLVAFVPVVFMVSSFNVHADDSHLKEAIKHTQEAVQATDAKTIAQHVEEAKKHAAAAKSEEPEDKHIQEGLKCLDDALRESRNDKTDSARKAASDALDKFNQAKK